MKGRKQSKSEEAAYPDLSTTPSTTHLPPDTEWEDHSQNLASILDVHSLPLVVKCDPRDLPSMANINFDFTQPLLLHTKRTVRKVVASNMVPGLQETGRRLLIPEDYKGWFAVFDNSSTVKPDTVIPHFKQVARLAMSKCRQFLIGGEQPLTAIQMPSSGGSLDRSQTRHVYPGDVLTMCKLFVGETMVTVKRSKLLGGNKTFKKEEKFLLCTDHNDRDLYLPVQTKGVFYVISTEENLVPKIPIMTIKDIMAKFRAPCVVKLVFGRVPSTPCSFTGLMTLHQHVTERSVIGCTMLNVRNILMEMPIDMDLKYYLASPSPNLSSSPCYQNALCLCQEKVTTYVRTIKVAYNLDRPDRVVQRDSNGQNMARTPDNPDGNTDLAPHHKGSHTPNAVDDQEICGSLETCKGPTATSPTSKEQDQKQPSKFPANSDAVFEKSEPLLMLKKTQTFQEPSDRGKQKQPKSPLSSSQARPAGSGLSRQSGPYMKMSPPAAPLPHTMSRSLADLTRPPTPPPKSSRLIFGDEKSDERLYSQIRDGDTAEQQPQSANSQSTGFVQALGKEESSSAYDIPDFNPRLSRFGFGDTYLTLPMFRHSDSTDGHGTNPSMDLGSNPVPAAQTKMEEAREEKFNLPSATAPNSSSCSTKYGHYEIVSVVSARGGVHKSSDIDDTQSFQATTRPKETSSKTQPPPTSIITKSRPLPPLPDQKGELPLPALTENQQTDCKPSRDMSTLGTDQQTDHKPSQSMSTLRTSKELGSSQNVKEESDLMRVLLKAITEHKSKFTHATIQESQALQHKCSHEQNGDQGDTEQDPSQIQSEEEVVYVNVRNLQPCSVKVSVSSDSALDDVLGNDLNRKMSACSLGDGRSPSSRPVSKKPPPLPPKRSFDKGSRLKSTGMKTSFESDCSCDDAVFPASPTSNPGTANSTTGPPHLCDGAREMTATSGPYPQTCGDNILSASCPETIVDYATPPRLSCVDDLPLGATFENFTGSDSGCGTDSVSISQETSDYGAESARRSQKSSGQGRPVSSSLSLLSVQQLGQALQRAGLSQDSVSILQREKVDGRLLLSLSEDELMDTLEGVKKLDIRKILMFVTGWRPNE